MSLGRIGEEMAADFLRKSGYDILHRNFRIKIGEIDIIASINNIMVFCEVKTRRNCTYGYPIEAVTLKKQRTIRAIAEYYLATYTGKKSYHEIRFDIISILSDGKGYSLNHYLNAF